MRKVFIFYPHDIVHFCQVQLVKVSNQLKWQYFCWRNKKYAPLSLLWQILVSWVVLLCSRSHSGKPLCQKIILKYRVRSGDKKRQEITGMKEGKKGKRKFSGGHAFLFRERKTVWNPLLGNNPGRIVCLHPPGLSGLLYSFKIIF